MVLQQHDWPAELLELLLNLIDEWDISKLDRIRTINEGRSGAYVFAINIRSRPLNGQGILKINRDKESDAPTPTNPSKEAQQHSRAWQYNESFSQSNLPRLIESFTESGYQALLMQLAAGSLEFSISFRGIQKTGLRRQIQQVIDRELLVEWPLLPPIGPSALRKPLTTRQLFHAWLDYRSDAAHSRVPALLAARNIPASETNFLFDGRWLPNPWCFIQGTSPFGDPTLTLFFGPSHGDLHGGNVLIERRGGDYRSDHCYLIDLDHFQPELPIFYDHCYFMLDDLLRHAGDRSNAEWARLVFCIIEGGEPSYKDEGLVKSISEWRSALQQLFRRVPGSEEILEWQLYFASLAVGLVFAHRNLDHEVQRQNAFLFAAINLQRFLQIAQKESDWPKHVGASWEAPQIDGAKRRVAPSELRTLWMQASNFDADSFGYILVSAAPLKSKGLAGQLARLPFSLIVDASTQGGPFDSAPEFLQKASSGVPWHVFNSDVAVSVAYENGGRALIRLTPAGQENLTFLQWNRVVRKSIATQIRQAFAALKHKRFIVVLAPGPTVSDIYRNLVESIDGEVGDGIEAYLCMEPSEDNTGKAFASLEPTMMRRTSLDLAALADAAALMYGEEIVLEGIPVPHFDEGGVDRRALKLLDPTDAVAWQEDFDILHDEVGASEDLENSFERFLRGYEITWGGLREKHDVSRDYFEELYAEIQKQINLEPNRTININHAPGAGGSTLGLRLAWSFRRRFPTVAVKRYSPHLIDRLHGISTVTKLPLLVLLDARYVSIGEMQEIYSGLNKNHTKALLLQVSRRIIGDTGRRLTGRPTYLPAVMSDLETKRFVEVYEQFADNRAKNDLIELAQNAQRARYRTPFFFGVTVFGNGYRLLSNRVKEAIDAPDPRAAKLLAILSLCSRYSQRRFPISIAKVILGQEPRDRVSIDDLIGEHCAALIIQEKGEITVIHPIIAEEIIMAFHGVASMDDERWKYFVPDLAKVLIESASKAQIVEGEFEDFLQDLFIQRAQFLDEVQPFAPIISELSPESSAEILRKLTECFPNNSHFYHHLGRLYDRRLKMPLADCVPPLKKAVELEKGRNDVHHHGLGMVYRAEVFRIAEEIALSGNDLNRLLKLYEAVRPVLDLATASFEASRNLSPDSEYAYVSQIQMNIGVVDSFYTASESNKFAEFLKVQEPYIRWCAELISQAEDQLDRVKGMNPERRHSDRVERCDMRLLEITDHRDLVISSYDALLQNPKVISKDWVRRGLSHQLFRKLEESNKPDQKEVAKLCGLLEDNIKDNPAKNSRDIRLWFRAYRMHRGFTLSLAMQRVDQWAASSDETEAYYYRYILQFVAFTQKRSDNLNELKGAIKLCKDRLSQEEKTYVYEWWLGKPHNWPIISTRALGESSPGPAFERLSGPEALLLGKIAKIERGQLGFIDYNGLMLRFSPGQKFIRGQHEQRAVRFKVGFRFDGPLAWDPEFG